MNVLHVCLEDKEVFEIGGLYFGAELFDKIVGYDGVGAGEEGQDLFDEALLVCGEAKKVRQVFGRVDFFGCPEAGLLAFEPLPTRRVDVTEIESEAMVLAKDGLRKLETSGVAKVGRHQRGRSGSIGQTGWISFEGDG